MYYHGHMPRKIDQNARREEIAEAVWSVIVEEGVAAVSVRSVAARAEIAVGSLRHVFPTRDELVEFSAELMILRTTERLRSLPASDDPVRYALDVCTALLPLDADSRAEVMVNLALIAEAPAIPRLAEIRDDAHRQLRELCRTLVGFLRGTGPEAVDDIATDRLHALVDGLALHLLTTEQDADSRWAVDVLRRELEATAAGR